MHRLVRALCNSKSLTRPPESLWRAHAALTGPLRRYRYTVARPKEHFASPLELALSSRDLKAVEKEWGALVSADRAKAIRSRGQIYKFSKANNLRQWWLAEIISIVPPDERLLSDYQYSLRMLFSLDAKDAALKLIDHISHRQPVFAEILVGKLIEKKRIRTVADLEFSLDMMITVLVAQDISIDQLSRTAHRQYLRSLETIISVLPDALVPALQSLFERLPVGTLQLASAALDILFSSKDAELARVCRSVWAWKSENGTATASDLRRIMFHYLSLNKPKMSLRMYDENSGLHERTQSDALLLAAAQTQEWDRVQETFRGLTQYSEKALATENGDALGKVFSSYYFVLTLQALGDLGARDILQNLFNSLVESGRQPSRAVLESMMHSYSVIGLAPMAQKFFDIMVDDYGYTPSRASFVTLLTAYRDAQNLPAALALVGKMVAQYFLPLTNKELTLLLSLCARTHDAVMAAEVFSWAQKQLEPDLISYNAYIDCLARVDTRKAWKTYLEMPYEPDIYTLTSLVSAFGRYGDTAKVEELNRTRVKLKIPRNAHWMSAMLFYYTQIKDFGNALSILEFMKNNNYKLESGLYGVLVNSLSQQGRFEEAKQLAEEAKEHPPTYSYYSKYLYMLSQGATEDTVKGHDVAMGLLHSKMFDTTSRVMPRNQAPVNTIKQLFYRHIEDGRTMKATQLMVQMRAELTNQELQLAALDMILQQARGRYRRVGMLWETFVGELRRVAVPQRLPSGEIAHKLPKQYRYDFYRQVSARLMFLAETKRFREILLLPGTLEELGLGMSSKNWNLMARLLLSLPADNAHRGAYAAAAFGIVNSWLMRNYYRSQQAKAQGSISPSPRSSATVNSPHAHGVVEAETLRALRNATAFLFQFIASAQSVTPEGAQKLLSKEYPLVMGAVNWGLRKARQRRARELAATRAAEGETRQLPVVALQPRPGW